MFFNSIKEINRLRQRYEIIGYLFLIQLNKYIG